MGFIPGDDPFGLVIPHEEEHTIIMVDLVSLQERSHILKVYFINIDLSWLVELQLLILPWWMECCPFDLLVFSIIIIIIIGYSPSSSYFDGRFVLEAYFTVSKL